MSFFGKIIIGLFLLMLPRVSTAAMLSLGDFGGAPGQEAYAWLRIEDATGLASMQFQINYDRNLMTFISATNHVGTLGAQFALDVEPGDGFVIVRLFRDSSLESGAGDLVTLRFGINTGAEEGMSAALVLAETDLATQYGADLRWKTPVVTQDAVFTVNAAGTSDLLFVRNASVGGTVIGDSSGFYPAARMMSVTATPAEHFYFAGWEGDVEGDPTNSTLQVVLSRPREVTARFEPYVTASTRTPHWWLASLGYTGNYEVVAMEDPLGKGTPLWQDYVAGTDPNIRSDRFVVDSVTNQNDRAIFRFVARSGRRYNVLYRQTLTDDQWRILGGYSNINGADQTVTVDDTSSATLPMRFYRIAVELPPSGQ